MENKSKRIGKVLWWSDKDKNGIICDSYGNEYYFDVSVLNLSRRQNISRNIMVTFLSDKVEGLLTAKEVCIPQLKQARKYEMKFEQERTQLTLPLCM